MRKILLLLIAFLPIIVNAQTEKSDLTLNDGTQDKQVKVMMRNGTVILGNLKEFDPLDHITLIIAGVEAKIPMSEVAYVDQKESANANNANSEKTIEQNPIINHSVKDYNGFLLEKGNNVYVYCDNDKYGKRGAERLRSLLIKDGFWNVVDRMEDAHFTINYGVTLRRGDKLLLSVSSWRAKELIYLAIQRKWEIEDEYAHERYAQELYDDYVVPFQKKIANGKLAKSIVKKFTVE